MESGENNVWTIFHLNNRWRGGKGGGDEGRGKGRIVVGKHGNRGHSSSSNMYHQQQSFGYRGGGTRGGFTDVSVSAETQR